MQNVTTAFNALAQGDLRPVAARLQASFNKDLDESVNFFTLDQSLLDGIDVLAPSDNNPIQEWDKYPYTNYSSRIVSMEITREENMPYSIVQSYGDITLNNYDGFFMPGGSSPISSYILPRRPFRMYMGFGNEVVQQLVGLSAGMPTIDKSSRTVDFHVIDFLSYLFDRDITRSATLTNARTDEILDYLLQLMGLLPDQYVLDRGINTVSYFYVDKGQKLGGVIEKLMEAEMGRLYMDENGIFTFKNRYNYDWNPVYYFDNGNINSYEVSSSDKIINSVTVKGEVRKEQELQPVWSLPEGEYYEVPAGQSYDVWVEFEDPMVTLNNPAFSLPEINNSYFTARTSSEGGSAYVNVVLQSVSLFSKTAVLRFQNTGISTGFITVLNLFGTPAKVVDVINVQESDPDSVDAYEEQSYEIENPYIQDRSNAISRALLIVRDYKDYNSSIDIDVKGNPAIQLGDAIDINIDTFSGVYIIKKIVNIISDGKFTQRISATKKTITQFFTLDQSVLNGTDVLAP